MTDRQAFEAWVAERAQIARDSRHYTAIAWSAWQAATLAERKRCASMLDEVAKDYREIGDTDMANQTEFLAEYIRA